MNKLTIYLFKWVQE
jgi:hypothetical protein